MYASQQEGNEVLTVFTLISRQYKNVKRLSYPLFEGEGRVKVLYVEWSPTPYRDCYLPGIDAAIRVSLSGIKNLGLPDENENFHGLTALQIQEGLISYPSGHRMMRMWLFSLYLTYRSPMR